MDNKKTLATIQWEGVQGVGWIQKRDTEWRYFWKKLAAPIQHRGQSCLCLVREFEIIPATGEKKCTRGDYAGDTAAALAICKRWQKEHLDQLKQEDEDLKKCIAEQSEELLLKQKPPAQCDSITKTDLQDYKDAQRKLLREKHPKMFEAKNELDLKKAYLLDAAKLTGEIDQYFVKELGAEFPEMEFIKQLAEAGAPDKRNTGKSADMIRLKEEILRGWKLDGYQFMTRAERTQAINKRTGGNYSDRSVRTAVNDLTLVPKRKDGPKRKQEPDESRVHDPAS